MAHEVMKLGVPDMDAEHAALAALFATVAETPGPGLAALLARIEHETAAHFAHEERMMEAARFPVLFCHRAQHRRLMTEFDVANRMLDDDDLPALRHHLGEVIPTLVSAHVASVDRVTAGFLTGELKAADFEGFALPALPPVPERA
jgi:hemerythrin